MAAFLRSVQNTAISEAEFLERYVQISYNGSRQHSQARGRNRARYEYRNLLKNFDFFAPKA